LLVPVVGIVAAGLVQGEVPGVTELVGGAIMLAGSAAAVLQWRRTSPQQL
jgi:O-acetylserine/cysteine efflux transporter